MPPGALVRLTDTRAETFRLYAIFVSLPRALAAFTTTAESINRFREVFWSFLRHREMLSPLCADLPASLVRVIRNHVVYELADFYGAAPGVVFTGLCYSPPFHEVLLAILALGAELFRIT